MPTPILMPQLSPTMEVGSLTKWHVKEGDRVSSGDVIAEIETDKATMEVEAVDEGTVGKLLVSEGTEEIPVNKPIAVLLQEGEDKEALKDFQPETQTASASGTPRGGNGAGEGQARAGSSQASSQASKPDQAVQPPGPERPIAPPPDKAKPGEAAAPSGRQIQAEPRGEGRIFASPLARRLARENGIELGAIQGSGPHGRIVQRDVEQAVQAGAKPKAAAPKPAEAAPQPAAQPAAPAAKAPAQPGVPAKPEDLGYPEGSYDVLPIDTMRRTVARRMSESMRTIPHYYLTVDCRIDALIPLRKELNSRSKDYRLSVNDFLVRAAALALLRVPEVNSSWTEGGILRHKHADIAMAVAIESGGLITPIIPKADTKGLAAISREARDLTQRARERKLKPEEYQGGTFTISNLGMFGIRDFTAVINQPQAAILAVGRAEPRPIVKEGAVTTATMLSCTLSCDHRLVDGAVGARFLDVFRGLLEDPLTMLL